MSLNPRHFRQERREFIRVATACRVTYSFIAERPVLPAGETFEGTTDNISGGGLKLVGELPGPDLIPDLLLGRAAVGVNVFLPGSPRPVRALTRTAWIELAEKKDHKFLIGLRFREISADDRERIVQFIIEAQVR